MNAVDSFLQESQNDAQDFEENTRHDTVKTEENVKEDTEVDENFEADMEDDENVEERYEPLPLPKDDCHNRTTMFFNKYGEDTDIPSIANRLAEAIVILK